MRQRRELAPERAVAMLALAVVFDAVCGEPPARYHPVVAMGRLIAIADRCAPRGRPGAELVYGAALAIGGAAACAAGAAAAEASVQRWLGPLGLPVGAVLLKTTFAVRALEEAAEAVAQALAADDLGLARRGLRALVSREAGALDRELVAAAAVESVAENLSDSFVGPLVWYALLGVPGAVAYRFANTCDAMLGYRGDYEYLGKAAARLDDAANWLPARLSALLLVAAAGVSGGDARGAWRMLRRDHARTASPNAGWPMSATAGALGVRLEKPGQYVLGDGGRPAGATAIRGAVRLARVAATLAMTGHVAWVLMRRANAAAP